MPTNFSNLTAELINAYVKEQGSFVEMVKTMCFHDLLREQQAYYNQALEDTVKRLAGVIEELISNYANDLNSSTLRQWVVLTTLGIQPNLGKLGFDGVKGNTNYEVKPKNVQYPSPTDKQPRKLNGGGNFSDFTKERMEKYENSVILPAGFINGRLIYILEVPFNCIRQHLEQQLNKKLSGKRKPGEYLRSAEFSFRHYKQCRELKVAYLSPNWTQFEACITKELATFFRGVLWR